MEELAQLEQLVRNGTFGNEQFLISSIRGDEMNQISNGAILLNILNIVQKLEAGEKFTKSLNFDAPGKSLSLSDSFSDSLILVFISLTAQISPEISF